MIPLLLRRDVFLTGVIGGAPGVVKREVPVSRTCVEQYSLLGSGGSGCVAPLWEH